MEIIIKNSSGQPIYEQIFTQIKNLILKGICCRRFGDWRRICVSA